MFQNYRAMRPRYRLRSLPHSRSPGLGQAQEGATALIVCGTTGEAPTLSPAEHGVLIRIAVGVARGRIPVIAGAGSNSTTHATRWRLECNTAAMRVYCKQALARW
jgi:hypothetical protein